MEEIEEKITRREHEETLKKRSLGQIIHTYIPDGRNLNSEDVRTSNLREQKDCCTCNCGSKCKTPCPFVT
jgi:hypothetical protein